MQRFERWGVSPSADGDCSALGTACRRRLCLWKLQAFEKACAKLLMVSLFDIEYSYDMKILGKGTAKMKNEFQVTKDLYMSWGRENMRKGSRLKFRILWCITAILLICFIVLLKMAGDGRMYLYAYGVAMTVYCFYRAFFRDLVLTGSQYRRNVKIFGSENWVRTIEFKEEEIVCKDGSVTVRTPYSEIAGMRDDGNKIWLDTKKKMVIRLYKDKFIGGDFEKFKKFISVKIGE